MSVIELVNDNDVRLAVLYEELFQLGVHCDLTPPEVDKVHRMLDSIKQIGITNQSIGQALSARDPYRMVYSR